MARLERIHLIGMTLALLFWTGCEDPSPRAPVEAPPPALIAANEARSGSYDVSGVTVQAMSGEQREISGTLKLDVEGERYEVEFELETTAPDLEGQVPVSVKGGGRGFIVGGVFTGTTSEWMALVPSGGLDEVALHDVDLPAKAGRKLVSTSQASFDPDGTMNILMQNYPGSGEHYEASMTVLEGRRVSGP